MTELVSILKKQNEENTYTVEIPHKNEEHTTKIFKKL